MILFVDNYDSFTYNLLHAIAPFADIARDVRVARNDTITAAEIAQIDPEILIISPGPGSPAKAGVSVAAIAASIGVRPVLGVCLGHQSLACALGGRVARAKRLVHGKSEAILHNGAGLFVNLTMPFTAARYHSLVIDAETLPAELEVTARSRDGEIMAVAHRTAPAFGVQFHPESFLTPDGAALLRNFFHLAREFNKNRGRAAVGP